VAELLADRIVEDDSGMAWKLEGVCNQTDPELFFPEQRASTAVPKRICAKCPVRVRCLNHALEHHEGFGIWGGMTTNERKRLLATTRERRTAA